jgi:hypothetical protein
MFHIQWTAEVTRVLEPHRFPAAVGGIVAEYSSLLTLDEMKCAVAADRDRKHGEVRRIAQKTHLFAKKKSWLGLRERNCVIGDARVSLL